MKHFEKIALFIAIVSFSVQGFASNGYELWLGYHKIQDGVLLEKYQRQISSVYFEEETETLKVAKNELLIGLSGLLGVDCGGKFSQNEKSTLIVLRKNKLNTELLKVFDKDFARLDKDGFIIKSVKIDNKNHIVITAYDDAGILYGVFNFLRLLQTNRSLAQLSIVDSPKIDVRILNHWDNLDGTVERGYAGGSIWNWQKLPEYIDQRYIDYARANASVGINGTVLNNVNANALILTPQYLEKVEALADVFRPYGIKVYLTARFSAPIEIGELTTADPLNTEVQQWWKKKAEEIYKRIPDFGGFVVKANSEGQPGPQNYDRTHADGARMLAEAVAPFKGIVMWRAFVYSEHDPDDRAKQAYNEFVPFDGQFPDNVLIQVKNGPIDFQPREPFHPMFGAMPETNVMMEFQITQEYLGFSTHLVFLPKLYEEVLRADTFIKGEGSTVAKSIDGSLNARKITGIAGVSNIGADINWTGHVFAQANWYGFGRLAWNPYLSSEEIADEWLRSTFSNKREFLDPMISLLIDSRETVVNYMTPLGLHHIMDTGHHYGPGPWVKELSRPEWNPVYYHKADSLGIGFDRSEKGSNAIAQYAGEVAKIYNDPNTCPEELLLWFHHLPWDYTLTNGESLWDGLALKYQQGVDEVEGMILTWDRMKPYVDEQRFNEVRMLLNIQYKESKWWRDACLLYFQTYSKQELPQGVEQPEGTLEYYKSLKFPFAPGN